MVSVVRANDPKQVEPARAMKNWSNGEESVTVDEEDSGKVSGAMAER